MIVNHFTNPCSRCGNERVVTKTWIEKQITFSGEVIKIECTENSCPDPVCEEIISKELAAQKEKRMLIAMNKEKRAKDNQQNRGGLHRKK